MKCHGSSATKTKLEGSAASDSDARPDADGQRAGAQQAGVEGAHQHRDRRKPGAEELEESVPLIDDVALKEAERERSVEEIAAQAERDKRDPFDEIDFGSYFQDYLDPGFRTPNGFEQTDKPSFENFLSQPSTLTDHLFWQLGSLNLSRDLRAAAEYVVGNLDEDGYLMAGDEELLAGLVREYDPLSVAPPGAASELLAEAV